MSRIAAGKDVARNPRVRCELAIVTSVWSRIGFLSGPANIYDSGQARVKNDVATQQPKLKPVTPEHQLPGTGLH